MRSPAVDEIRVNTDRKNLMFSDKFKTLKVVRKIELASPILSIVVRVKNEGQELPRFLASLELQTLIKDCEIIFLDSGSTDNTLDLISQLNCSIYSIDGREFSFGPTCNLLMELSKAEYVGFFSGHVVLSKENVLEEGYRMIAGEVSGAGYFRQLPNQLCGCNAYESAFLARRFPENPVNPLRVYKNNSFSNAASIISRAAWSDNPFDDVGASEDHLWAIRHLNKNRPLFYFPKLEILHSHNETPDQVFDRVRSNVRARYGEKRMYLKSAYFFVGVFLSVLRHGGEIAEALRYAKAHSMAYLGESH